MRSELRLKGQQQMSSPLPPVLQVPLFPLPGVVLFPGSVLPLRVFEPRYIQLLKDVMATDKLIGIAHVKPGLSFSNDSPGLPAPSVYDVLGVGLVVAHQPIADGTYHIALLGQARCRISAEIPHQPYRMASVLTLRDRLPSRPEHQQRLRAAQNDLLEISRSLLARTVESEACEQLKKIVNERSEPGPLADLLASIYVQDSALKQSLLESTDVLARLRILQAIMEKLMVRLEPKPAPLEYRHDDICLN